MNRKPLDKLKVLFVLPLLWLLSISFPDNAYCVTFTGTDGDDVVAGGSPTDDTYYLLGGNDSVLENIGNDTYIGGPGNDLIRDKSGDDTYIFNLGDGQDIIYDGGGTDQIRFGAGITKANTTYTLIGNDIVITLNQTGDSITIKFWCVIDTYHYKIEKVQYEDGSFYTQDDIEMMVGLATNHPPVPNAGDNITIASYQKPTTTIQGSATDQDGDPLQYKWSVEDQILLDWSPVGSGGQCPLALASVPLGIGTYTLTLTVSDGHDTASNSMILTIGNSAPNVAVTGGAGTYELGSEVVLSADISDYDGNTLSYQWKEGSQVLASGTKATISGGTPVSLPDYSLTNFSLGSHTITIEVSDGTNDPVSTSIQVTIQDTQAPTLSPTLNKSILWPPNHAMVPITILANASDSSGDLVHLSASVRSNEPLTGTGTGDLSPDWSVPVVDECTGMITLNLRAERSGSGNGREYTITVTAKDGSGNTSSADLKVIVPHDNSKK